MRKVTKGNVTIKVCQIKISFIVHLGTLPSTIEQPWRRDKMFPKYLSSKDKLQNSKLP